MEPVPYPHITSTPQKQRGAHLSAFVRLVFRFDAILLYTSYLVGANNTQSILLLRYAYPVILNTPILELLPPASTAYISATVFPFIIYLYTFQTACAKNVLLALVITRLLYHMLPIECLAAGAPCPIASLI